MDEDVDVGACPDLDAAREDNDEDGRLGRRGKEIEGVERPDRCWGAGALEEERAMENGLGLGWGVDCGSDDGGGDEVGILIKSFCKDYGISAWFGE